MNKKIDSKRKFYCTYTILFLIASSIIFSPFFLEHKSLIWYIDKPNAYNDGLCQHYNAFVYYGQYLRKIFENLIFSHQLKVPQWEFGIGYGGDVITTLSYYVIGDPISFLSLFVPTKYSEFAYSILILFRIYLSGIGFCTYARKMKCNNSSVLCAVFAYIFCGFTIFSAVRHPYFINPMIYLPLILLGVEKVFKKENPILYISMVFISAISNFYFFYMLVLLIIIYVIFRYLSFENKTVKEFLFYCIKFLGFASIGVLMAAFILLPTAMFFLETSRISSNYKAYYFRYSKSYYLAFISRLVTGRVVGSYTLVNWTPMILVGIVYSFFKTKKDRWLKGLLVLFTVFLCIPYFGHVFNGFGYISNRWSFAYSFIAAFILARTIPEFF
ncbi:hypothetical protein P261_00970 [Lachnospiraceae bacterium TWA4]|nr:hypothetical protein P261_00970 [Lachnospiraceae bacterium TWA4]